MMGGKMGEPRRNVNLWRFSPLSRRRQFFKVGRANSRIGGKEARWLFLNFDMGDQAGCGVASNGDAQGGNSGETFVAEFQEVKGYLEP